MVQADAKPEQRTATRQIDRRRVRSLRHSRVPGRRQRAIPPEPLAAPVWTPVARADLRNSTRSLQGVSLGTRNKPVVPRYETISNARCASLVGLLGWTVLDWTSRSADQTRSIEGHGCQDLGTIRVQAGEWRLEPPSRTQRRT